MYDHMNNSFISGQQINTKSNPERSRIMKQFLLVLAVICMLLPLSSSAATPKDSGQRLVVVFQSEPDTIDSTRTRMTTVTNPIMQNVNEKLVGSKTSGELIPGLATWKVSSDGKVIDFTLKKGVKFHSGDLLTAKDVEFTHEREMKLNPIYSQRMNLLEKFELVNDYQFRYVFKKPDVRFLIQRGPDIASKAYYDRVGEDEFVKRPVGTGPYKVADYKMGEYIDFEAFADYWGGPPAIKQVRVYFIKEDSTRVSKLRAGEADIIMSTPFSSVKELESAGFKTVKIATNPTCSIQFHTTNPNVPWANKKVRLAMAYAIDTETIVKNVLQGIPGRYPTVGPWELGYDPNLKMYPYDPKKAKEMLADAGYPKGFDMPLYYMTGRVSGMKETTEAVALYLNAIGVRAKVEGLEAPILVEKVRAVKKDPNGQYVAVSTIGAAHYPDPTIPLVLQYHSSSPMGVYANPEFDAVLDQALITLDNKKRGEFIKKAVRILYDDVASIPLWHNISIFSMKKNIEYTPTLKQSDPIMMFREVKIKN